MTIQYDDSLRKVKDMPKNGHPRTKINEDARWMF